MSNSFDDFGYKPWRVPEASSARKIEVRNVAARHAEANPSPEKIDAIKKLLLRYGSAEFDQLNVDVARSLLKKLGMVNTNPSSKRNLPRAKRLTHEP